MKRKTSLAVLAGTVLFAQAAAAVPPATPGQRHEVAGNAARPPVHVVELLTSAQATAEFAKIAAWDVTMQSTSCVDPDAGVDASSTACEAGGIIEVETGPGMAIVASDNTQEAIGLWNLNEQLNHKAYLPNIADAFDYLSTHPGYLAWKLTKDTGPDYYSVYNCGWGVRAVMLYEATTKDMSHHAYGVECANHIATYASTLVDPGADLLNVGPAGWAASGLWLWGDTYAESAMKTTAASIGAQVKTWIEATPAELSTQEWAMSGGAPYYGVIESYMKENPAELTAWVTKFAPMLGGWIDESKPADPNDWTDWRNAWNAWNMLAQFTSAQVLGTKAGSTNQATADDILAKLVAQANPETGAIAGSQQRPSTEAESWITAYLAYFGLLEVIGEAPIADAGAEGGVKDAGAKDTGAKDAATPEDAGTPPRDATLDAGGSGSGSGGGCGCGLVGAGGGPAPLGVLLGLFLLSARRRSARR